MPPAIIAAGIVAAGAIGGAALSSHATSSAANQANQSQQQATQAQTQLGQQSLALNKDIYNSNYNMLSPWVSRGNVAGDAYSSLLGLPAAPAMHSPLQGAAGTSAPPPVAGNATPASSWSSMTPAGTTQSTGTPTMLPAVNALAPTSTSRPGLDAINASRAGRGLPALGGGTPATPAPGTTPTTTPATTAHAASPTSAMNNFANSAGMQFQLAQGTNAINNLYAAHGQLQSGAAAKAIQNYGQQTALQNYFMPYMSMVNGVSAQGAQAGAAVAGVGSSFGNTAANINGQIGGAIQNGADSTSNAAIARGYGQGQMWNTVGQQVGNIASSFVPTAAAAPPNFNAATNPLYGPSFY